MQECLRYTTRETKTKTAPVMGNIGFRNEENKIKEKIREIGFIVAVLALLLIGEQRL